MSAVFPASVRLLGAALAIAWTFEAAPASAGPFEEIVLLQQRGYHAAARRLMRPLAEEGDPRAQYELASMMFYGDGGPLDYAGALHWFQAAADRGHIESQRMLGTIYGSGAGVPRSYEQAAKWYRRAAAQGDTSAQTSLGLLHENGLGVARDTVEAYKWFEIVLIRFPELRDNREDAVVINRNRVAAKMSAEQIREAERRARAWTAKKE